ncbi:uncharacterized protein LOC134201643 [Bombyx mori]|uniref:uncharacterized protein LOC134201643 n=1 Tax=Bombyx mori TaxID=7091 RepID=UPI002ED68ED6
MAARRGWPQYMYSDNGTNLRGANTELKKSIKDLDEDVLKDKASNHGIKWTFIPPASPHWGGAWERLIRSVKTSLKVILNERAPREETLNTLLTEVENMVNSRPLTHVSVNPNDPETLTPNHFLLGSSSSLPQIGKFDNSDTYMRKLWRSSQRLADMYWRRWVKEVLPDLIPRRKWQEERKNLQVGDLVLIVDPDGPRNSWPKGIILEVIPGRDNRVRMVLQPRNGPTDVSMRTAKPLGIRMNELYNLNDDDNNYNNSEIQNPSYDDYSNTEVMEEFETLETDQTEEYDPVEENFHIITNNQPPK